MQCHVTWRVSGSGKVSPHLWSLEPCPQHWPGLSLFQLSLLQTLRHHYHYWIQKLSCPHNPNNASHHPLIWSLDAAANCSGWSGYSWVLICPFHKLSYAYNINKQQALRRFMWAAQIKFDFHFRCEDWWEIFANLVHTMFLLTFAFGPSCTEFVIPGCWHLVMVQQVRLMMFLLNMVDHSMSFLSMSTLIIFWLTIRGDLYIFRRLGDDTYTNLSFHCLLY